MRNSIVITCLFFALNSCESRENNFDNEESTGLVHDSILKKDSFDIEHISEYTKELDHFLTAYVDSLSLYPNIHFLFDQDFDIKNPDLAYRFRNTFDTTFVSLRVELFGRIDEVNILHEIIDDPLQDTLYNNDLHRRGIPSDNYSNKDLAIMRLKEIETGEEHLFYTFLKDPTIGAKVVDSISK